MRDAALELTTQRFPCGPSLDPWLVLDGDARAHVGSLARASGCFLLTDTSITAVANKCPNLTTLHVR